MQDLQFDKMKDCCCLASQARDARLALPWTGTADLMLAPRKVLDICVAAIMTKQVFFSTVKRQCADSKGWTMRLSCALRYKLLSQQQDRSLILIGDLDQGSVKALPLRPRAPVKSRLNSLAQTIFLPGRACLPIPSARTHFLHTPLMYCQGIVANFRTEVEYTTRPSFQLMQHSLAMRNKSGSVNKFALYMQGCCLWKALYSCTGGWTTMQSQVT